MNQYRILDTENNRLFKPNMIGLTLEGEQHGEYIKLDGIFFLECELEKVKEVKNSNKLKTNKTKVVNSLKWLWDAQNNKQVEEYKTIKKFQRALINRTIKDIESIEYYYNSFIEMYYYSSMGSISYLVKIWLEDAVKEILKSDIKLNSFCYQDVKRWFNEE